MSVNAVKPGPNYSLPTHNSVYAPTLYLLYFPTLYLLYNVQSEPDTGKARVINTEKAEASPSNVHFCIPCKSQVHSNANVRFVIHTAMTMKNVVFWDMKTQFVLHRRHITSTLPSPAS
jgi:hypothetical protein